MLGQVTHENRPRLVWVCGQVAPENGPLWICVGRSPMKIDRSKCECVGWSLVKMVIVFFKRGRLPKIKWSFSFFLLYKTYYAKSLLRKHCKKGGNCHNPFLGYSPIHIFSSLLKIYIYIYIYIIQKNQKNIIKKYNSEKRMPERSENSQNLVGEF